MMIAADIDQSRLGAVYPKAEGHIYVTTDGTRVYLKLLEAKEIYEQLKTLRKHFKDAK